MDTNELLYQTEMALQHSKAPYGYQKGKVVGSEKRAGGDEHTLYNKKAPTVGRGLLLVNTI